MSELSSSSHRWLRIGCRAAHILAFSGFAGGHFLGVDGALLQPWLLATVLSGVVLAGTFSLQGFGWLLELRGLAILTKLALLLLIQPLWSWRGWLLAAVILLSSVSSHMPGRWRYRVPWIRVERVD